MTVSRRVRALAAACALVCVAATAGCGSLDKSFENLVASSPTASSATYPAIVSGPGTRMSATGCEQYAKDAKPIECVKAPKGKAYLYVKTAAGEFGSAEYVPVDQFQATCTRETTTVKGPDDLTLVFTRGQRTIAVSHAGTSLGTVSDEYLWWVRHTSVSVNGTSKLGDGELTLSMRVTCEEPVPSKSTEQPDDSEA